MWGLVSDNSKRRSSDGKNDRAIRHARRGMTDGDGHDDDASNCQYISMLAFQCPVAASMAVQ